MTIPELITTVLGNVQMQFYGGRVREFMRDKRALTRSIARYGYECEQRGWQFRALDIACELSALLLKIRESKADIEYMPVYLEGAVDRHIRFRAEELSEKAKKISNQVKRVTSGIKPVPAVVMPSDVEVLAKVYQDLRSRQKRRGAYQLKNTVFKQPALL